MKRFALLLPACLLVFCTISHALDPPVKLWERIYTNIEKLYEIESVSTGGFICAGFDDSGNCVFRFDDDGNYLWSAGGSTGIWRGEDVDELSDGSFIATGANWVVLGDKPEGRYETVLFIQKFDSSGNVIWTKEYSAVDEFQEGLGITILPDGGFAVCGRVNGTGSGPLGQAWILRTDANGDTLWTDVWGEHTVNYGKSVTYHDGEIVVLVFGYGGEITSPGSHLLFYDLNGNYLGGTTYPENDGGDAVDLCPTSDGGFAFVSRKPPHHPRLLRTDGEGVLQWYSVVDAIQENEPFGIRQTMDNGFLFCGWDGQFSQPDPLHMTAPIAQVDTGSTQDGWLVRFDSEGNELWNFRNEMGHNNHFYSAVQLPEGGYIAGGTYTGSGYLVRYAPETGIEGEEPSPFTTLDIAPNPFSSSMSISYSLPELALVELSVYDLSGRLVEELPSGTVSAGEQTAVWVPDPALPDGCYLIVLDACGERAVRRCVKLD